MSKTVDSSNRSTDRNRRIEANDRVETLMYRYKTILEDRLASRKESTQATEVAVKLDVLNRMLELGMPKSYKVAS